MLYRHFASHKILCDVILLFCLIHLCRLIVGLFCCDFIFLMFICGCAHFVYNYQENIAHFNAHCAVCTASHLVRTLILLICDIRWTCLCFVHTYARTHCVSSFVVLILWTFSIIAACDKKAVSPNKVYNRRAHGYLSSILSVSILVRLYVKWIPANTYVVSLQSPLVRQAVKVNCHNTKQSIFSSIRKKVNNFHIQIKITRILSVNSELIPQKNEQ